MTCCLLLTTVALTYVFTRSKPVYLIDYHCYKPPDRYACCSFQQTTASKSMRTLDKCTEWHFACIIFQG